jgi:hypothetical protein
MSSYLTLKDLYQYLFICNAKCDGWKVTKLNSNTYEFKKNLESLSQSYINNPNLLTDFIKKYMPPTKIH